MLERADVERIIENVLEELSIEISGSDFYDQNARQIQLLYGKKIISTAYFTVESSARDGYG